jgi:hypothetical protein
MPVASTAAIGVCSAICSIVVGGGGGGGEGGGGGKLYLRLREFVTGNEISRIVAHRCIMEASTGKRTVQTIEAPHKLKEQGQQHLGCHHPDSVSHKGPQPKAKGPQLCQGISQPLNMLGAALLNHKGRKRLRIVRKPFLIPHSRKGNQSMPLFATLDSNGRRIE